MTAAPGTTAPSGSVTRPLTLAVLTVSCARRRGAAAGTTPSSAHSASASPYERELIEHNSCKKLAEADLELCAATPIYRSLGGGASGRAGRAVGSSAAKAGSAE